MDASQARFAVVDIGSNTVKLSVYVCHGIDTPEVLYQEFDTVRVGHGMSTTGSISDDRASRLIATLQRMEHSARERGATRLAAVATQAFRQASNGERVRSIILEQTNWPIEIISGDDEARLTLEGARPFLEPGRAALIADIGGASTEIVLVSTDGDKISGGSVTVGSGLLYDDHINSSPPPPGTLTVAKDHAADRLSHSRLLPDRTETLLLAGGTGQLLTELLATIAPNATLDHHGLALLHEWLSTREGAATAERLGIQLERAQVLPASLVVVEALVALLGPSEVRAIPSGVGLGVAQTICLHER